mmetsp:Transcript_38036/g.93028  ORF Transcript_38036/g.93028 Transcript_38036/m.93028 type:complete len:203 (+) Transcript_38036:1002-1610(+)
MRALGVTISRPVLRPSLVPVILALPAVRIHLHKIQSAIQTTWQLRHVNIECELLVLQLEQLVGLLSIHQIRPAANVARVLTLRHKPQLQLVPVAGDAIWRRPILCRDPVQPAVARASLRIRTIARVPAVPRVAIRAAPHLMQPAPVRVQSHALLLCLASALRAHVQSHRQMHVLLLTSHLLRRRACKDHTHTHAEESSTNTW